MKLSWEQEVARAAEIVAYHAALATTSAHEARVHVLAQKAGELLWAALDAPSLHHVYVTREEFTDGARFKAISPGTRNTLRTYDDLVDPQGKATVHVDVQGAITVYGDRKDDRSRFALIGGDHTAESCAKQLDEGNRFFLVASDDLQDWIRPQAANVLKRLVLLEWQALGEAVHRDWSRAPEATGGRVARLAYAAWMYRCLILKEARIPGADAPYLPANGFRMADGKPVKVPADLGGGISALLRGKLPNDEEREAAWDKMTAPLRRPGESWTLSQVDRIARRSREIRVNAPPMLLPLLTAVHPRYRRLSLMQFLTHHLCDAQDGPRLHRADAAEWLRIPPNQVRQHASRANAKLGRAPKPSKSGRTSGDRATPNRSASQRTREVKHTSKNTTPPPNGPSQTGKPSGGNRGNNAPAPKGK